MVALVQKCRLRQSSVWICEVAPRSLILRFDNSSELVETTVQISGQSLERSLRVIDILHLRSQRHAYNVVYVSSSFQFPVPENGQLFYASPRQPGTSLPTPSVYFGENARNFRSCCADPTSSESPDNAP